MVGNSTRNGRPTGTFQAGRKSASHMMAISGRLEAEIGRGRLNPAMGNGGLMLGRREWDKYCSRATVEIDALGRAAAKEGAPDRPRWSACLRTEASYGTISGSNPAYRGGLLQLLSERSCLGLAVVLVEKRRQPRRAETFSSAWILSIISRVRTSHLRGSLCSLRHYDRAILVGLLNTALVVSSASRCRR